LLILIHFIIIIYKIYLKNHQFNFQFNAKLEVISYYSMYCRIQNLICLKIKCLLYKNVKISVNLCIFLNIFKFSNLIVAMISHYTIFINN